MRTEKEWRERERESVQIAVASEREACAKIADEVDLELGGCAAQFVASRIRARGAK